MNDKNLHSAIIRIAEALGGKNVSHDAVKNVSFQSPFKNCHGVRVEAGRRHIHNYSFTTLHSEWMTMTALSWCPTDSIYVVISDIIFCHEVGSCFWDGVSEVGEPAVCPLHRQDRRSSVTNIAPMSVAFTLPRHYSSHSTQVVLFSWSRACVSIGNYGNYSCFCIFLIDYSAECEYQILTIIIIRIDYSVHPQHKSCLVCWLCCLN